MKTTIEAGDREFLEALHRRDGATVQTLCDRMGVTATAVRQRLNRLLGLGMVMREAVRSGRGRPHHAYRVTDAGRKELGDNYADLALILWRELRNVEPDIRERIFERIRGAFIRQYEPAVQGESLADRIGELATALEERGFDVEVDDSGELPILRENNCPYLELASSDPSICEMEQAVFERVLGADMRLAQCCLEGHSCCEFHAVPAHGVESMVD
ncbi:MAG: MarR family transcriptional regulator [Planctomycetaceae bacterium]